MSEYLASFISYFSGSQKRRNILFATLIIAAVAIRVFLLWVPSWDVDSIQSKWYDELIKVGRIDAFREIFYNYTPAPVYLIDIMTLFRFIPKEPAMKILTVIFDFFAAWGVWKILRLRYPKGSMPWLGFFAFLYLPTVFVESGMWGQTDILFTTFLIWSFYYLLKEKTWPAMFFFAVAFCFKLQALFLGPVLLILLLRKKLPIYQFLMIPVVYFLSLVPCLDRRGSAEKAAPDLFDAIRDVSRTLKARPQFVFLFRVGYPAVQCHRNRWDRPDCAPNPRLRVYADFPVERPGDEIAGV